MLEKQWASVKFASDMRECPDCDAPYCMDHKTHYSECACIGPTEDGVDYKVIDGEMFGMRQRG